MTHSLAHSLRRLVPAGTGETDAELLNRFAREGDHASFTELVRLHGPTVLGVCRHIVGPDDADDTFQATFLLLARKAAAVRGSNRPVGGWRVKTAVNVASTHRKMRDRRRRRERNAAAGRPQSVPPASDNNLAAEEVLRQLSCLPEKERAAVMECELNRLTHDEAAANLGWKPGAVRYWLDRGMENLRNRLSRRGVTVPAGLAGIVVTQSVSHAKACEIGAVSVNFALGVETVSPAVTLAQGLLTMMQIKNTLVAGLAVIAAGLMIGTAWAVLPAPADQNGGVALAAQPAPAADGVIRSGMKVRFQGATGWWINCTSGDGPCQLVRKPNDDPSVDETFELVRVTGNGVLRHRDRVFLRMRPSWYLNTTDSSGTAQMTFKPRNNPSRDETLTVLRKAGDGVVSGGDEVHLLTEAQGGFYLNSPGGVGPVQAVRKERGPGRDETFTLRIAGP